MCVFQRFVSTGSKLLSILLLAQILIPALWATPASASDSPDIRIQFLPTAAATNEAYLPDHGETYDNRNGYTYGWNIDHTSHTVSGSVYEDPALLTSSVRMQAGSVWEIALPSGSYDIEISVGDAVYGSTNTLQVESVVFWDHVTLSAGEHAIGKKRIQLSDGKLTVRGDTVQSGTSIQWIAITKVEPAIRTMNSPYIGLPDVQNRIPGDKILLSGSQQNEHNAVPSIRIPGLNAAIDAYMSDQMSGLDERIAEMTAQAVSCFGCSAEEVQAAILGSVSEAVIMKVGHMNLDASATFGSPTKPVFLIVDGMNTNRELTLTVYGTLAITGNMNANQGLSLEVAEPIDPEIAGAGDLWVGGTIHLNNNSAVNVVGDMRAGSLTYNNGQLNVQAGRLIVANSMHINTRVDMEIAQEMLVGDLTSNNDTANIRVHTGDLFIQNEIHVNNHLSIQTGGVVAIGGSITANRKPIIATGASTDPVGQTKLQFTPYGLMAEYYTGTNLDGTRFTAVDPNVDIHNKLPISDSGLKDGNMSVRWTGQIMPYYTENYEFETSVRGGVKLWVNGELLIDQWEATGNGVYRGSLGLEAGVSYDIQLEYAGKGGQPNITLAWNSESGLKETVPQRQLSPFRVPALTATATESEVSLGWSTTFNATGYELEVDGVVLLFDAASFYTHEALETGTLHHYRVRAVSGDIKGEWSEALSVWTLPDVPSNIALEATSHSITLTWDEVAGASGYEIETDNTVIDNGSPTSYTDLNVNPNMPRTFRVRAYNASGPGRWSAIVAKSTLPAAPGGLHVDATDNSISVNWDAVSGADGYDLEADGAMITGINGTHYLHIDLLPNTTHTYRVRSYNGEGTSGWSAAIETVTLPPVPQHLRAVVAGDHIALAWDKSSGADAYDLEVDGAIVEAGDTATYVHSGLASNTEHTYRVRARHADVIGQWSNSITRTTLSGVPVNIHAVSTHDSITISWDPVIGAVGYEVEADGEVIANGLNTQFEHAGLLPFTDHTYRIRAVSDAGAGAWGEYVFVSTALDLPQLSAMSLSKSSISVSWTAVTGATAYELMIDGEIVGMGSDTTYLHQDLLPYSWHAYRVRAVSGANAGPWSDAVTRVTLLGTPVITKLAATSTQITVEWEAVPGATGYEIEADSILMEVGSETRFVHLSLLPNTSHSYRVRATNGSESGDWSDWSDIRTQSTPPSTPGQLKATAHPRFIELQWEASIGSTNYDLEIDGRIISGIAGTAYVHEDLEPNTMHTYRVRAVNSGGASPWSDALKQRTTPELTVDVGQGAIFNFVIVAPSVPDRPERIITVTYDPEELDIVDLSAATPETELEAGPIRGTNITIEEAANGKIVYRVTDTTKTIVNVIRFTANTNNDSVITYTIE